MADDHEVDDILAGDFETNNQQRERLRRFMEETK